MAILLSKSALGTRGGKYKGKGIKDKPSVLVIVGNVVVDR